MKIIISLLFAAALPFLSFAQSTSVSDLQEKYKDKSDCFTLTMSGNILSMFSGSGDGGKETSKTTPSLRILFVPKSSDGYTARDMKRLKAEIKRQSFEEVMSVKSKNGNIKALIKDSNGKMKEFVVLVDNTEEGFGALDFKGSLPD